MTKKTRRAKARRALLSISLVLVMMMAAVGGTIAWLTDSTDEIKNTFTVGNVDIDLTETANNSSNDGWEAELNPGSVYVKDPKVTVIKGSEECYLFVEVTQPKTIENILEYTLWMDVSPTQHELTWTKGDGSDIPANVWYTTISETLTANSNLVIELLKDNQVKVSENLTNQNMPSKDLTLSFKAYAAQTANMTAQQAWTEVSKNTNVEFNVGASATPWLTPTATPDP